MFRKLYKEANDEIEVNDQLIDSILKKANEKPKKKYAYRPALYRVAAAVILVIGCSTGISQLTEKPETESEVIWNPVRKVVTDNGQSVIYGVPSDNEETPEANSVNEDKSDAPVIETTSAKEPKTEEKKTTSTAEPKTTSKAVDDEPVETASPEPGYREPKKSGDEPAPAMETVAEAEAYTPEVASEIPETVSEDAAEAEYYNDSFGAPEDAGYVPAESTYEMSRKSSSGGGGSASASRSVTESLDIPEGFSTIAATGDYYEWSDGTKSFGLYENRKPSQTAIITFNYGGNTYYVVSDGLEYDEISRIFAKLI